MGGLRGIKYSHLLLLIGTKGMKLDKIVTVCLWLQCICMSTSAHEPLMLSLPGTPQTFRVTKSLQNLHVHGH